MNTFRKRLKQTGMETEFINWMKEPVKPGGFSEGDRVQLIKRYTDPFVDYEVGKKGVVTKVYEGSYLGLIAVKFDDKTQTSGLFSTRFKRI